MSKEIFKDIDGYEGLYQISNFGNVKSLPKRDGNGNRERILKQEIMKRDHTNYRRVAFSSNGIVKRFQVHRLVGLAFISNPENKAQINHIDNNGENNNASNLEWATSFENMRHSYNQGRLPKLEASGGIKGRKTRELKQIKRFESMKNKIYGKRQLLQIMEPYRGVKHPKALFKCLVCNIEFITSSLSPNYLNENTGPCKSCSLKAAHKKRKDKEIVYSAKKLVAAHNGAVYD